MGFHLKSGVQLNDVFLNGFLRPQIAFFIFVFGWDSFLFCNEFPNQSNNFKFYRLNNSPFLFLLFTYPFLLRYLFLFLFFLNFFSLNLLLSFFLFLFTISLFLLNSQFPCTHTSNDFFNIYLLSFSVIAKVTLCELGVTVFYHH